MYLAFAIGLATILVIVTLWVLLNRTVRRRVQAHLDSNLKGHTATLGGVRLHLFRSFVSLKNLTVSLEDHPLPPLAHVPELRFHLHHRRDLLSPNGTADIVVKEPSIHIDQGRVWPRKKEKLVDKDEEWRSSVAAVFPFNVEEFKVEGAELIYSSGPDSRPIRLRQVEFLARNIHSTEDGQNTFPTRVRGEGLVLDSGKVFVEGRVDFLSRPHMVFEVDYRLDQLDLGYFQPLIPWADISFRRGLLSASEGTVLYTEKDKIARVKSLEIKHLEADYVLSKDQDGGNGENKQENKGQGKQVNKSPGLFFIVDSIRLSESNLGFSNNMTDREYRVFVARSDIVIRDYSTEFRRSPAHVEWRGYFMDSGYAHLLGTFRPETDGPDFDLKLAVEDVQMTSLNKVLLAHTGFELADGRFSFYSEITVNHGRIEGYARPTFEDMQIHEDGKEGLVRKFYEGVVGKFMKLFERKADEHAPVETEISSVFDRANFKTWEAVLAVAVDSFNKIILPAFERQIRRLRLGD